MDQKNPFESPITFKLHRAEYLVFFAISIVLTIIHFGEINWWAWAGLFLYIDLIGYIPGAIAFRRRLVRWPGVRHSLRTTSATRGATNA